MSKGKGSSYEREVCGLLSQWWSGGTRTDIFWRSSNSGGRATVRNKAGKSTSGSYGDVAAIDADGVPLIKCLTIELKRGYSGSSFSDLVDQLDHTKAKEVENFIEQASRSAQQAKSRSWVLIHRRDKKKAVAIFPSKLMSDLLNEGAFEKKPSIVCRIQTTLKSGVPIRLYVIPLNEFLAGFNRTHVESLLKNQSGASR